MRRQLPLIQGAAEGARQPSTLQWRGAQTKVPLKGAEAPPEVNQGLQWQPGKQSPRAGMRDPAPSVNPRRQDRV
eukprot:14133527-Alexandrium_andersonii.AAC.1